MGRRWFSADFHLGFTALMEIEKWPFEDIGRHDEALLASCRKAAPGDVIIHVGDLASVSYDRHRGVESKGLSGNPMRLVESLPAAFVNVRGNHDSTNRVKSLAESMQIRLGRRFPQVTVGHYPSYDSRSAPYVRRGWINLCGHCHSEWKHCLDIDRQVLNVNVGCMAWGFEIVSEDDLVRYINQVLRHSPKEIFRCRACAGGKTEFMGDKTIGGF